MGTIWELFLFCFLSIKDDTFFSVEKMTKLPAPVVLKVQMWLQTIIPVLKYVYKPYDDSF